MSNIRRVPGGREMAVAAICVSMVLGVPAGAGVATARLVLAMLAGACSCGGEGPPGARSNVLLLTVDTLRSHKLRSALVIGILLGIRLMFAGWSFVALGLAVKNAPES